MLEIVKCEKPDRGEEAKQTYMLLNEIETKVQDEKLDD
jgi:hypothetical protein